MDCEAKHWKMTPFVFNRFSCFFFSFLLVVDIGVPAVFMRIGHRWAETGELWSIFDATEWLSVRTNRYRYTFNLNGDTGLCQPNENFKLQSIKFWYGNLEIDLPTSRKKYYLHLNVIFSWKCALNSIQHIDATQELFCIFLIKILILSMCVWVSIGCLSFCFMFCWVESITVNCRRAVAHVKLVPPFVMGKSICRKNSKPSTHCEADRRTKTERNEMIER